MKKPFERGDRIAAYQGGERFIAIVGSKDTMGRLMLEGHGRDFCIHEKQCRRLVKKKRRAIWIHEEVVTRVMKAGLPPAYTDYISYGEVGCDVFNRAQGTDYIKFIEAKK